MTPFLITATIAGHLCVERGYPNPDTDPNGWIKAIVSNVAHQIETGARDLDWASDMIRIAKARADYEPPRPLSAIEMKILEELAA